MQLNPYFLLLQLLYDICPEATFKLGKWLAKWLFPMSDAIDE